ncbi:ATP-binding protein [Streptomyces sp. NPDC007856]|uniref:ATP-binding protein n=1 Tax=Streptomyces sp. NPDC007856 TaxID=3364781 RepID=UPI0036B5487B
MLSSARTLLAPSGGDEADAVLLVVTELISNAVRHAGGVTGFGLRTGPGTVTVTVHDASRQPPRPQLTDPREPAGFGRLRKCPGAGMDLAPSRPPLHDRRRGTRAG